VHKSDKDGAGWYPRKLTQKVTFQDNPPRQGEVWFLERINEWGTRSWRHKEMVSQANDIGKWNNAWDVRGKPIVGQYYKLGLEARGIREWRETRTHQGFTEFITTEPI
jgi:hypothetical protein